MFEIPPRTSDRISLSNGVSSPTLNRNSAGSRQSTVLIIEDEPGVRYLVRRRLEAVGYRVLEAEEGVDGLRVVQEHCSEIDMVLTDIEMPRLDGISVAKEVAAKYPGIGVVCMSGGLQEDSFRERFDSWRPPFLAKPFSFDDLTRTTVDTIARAQQRCLVTSG